MGANVVRFDTAFSFYNDRAGNSGGFVAASVLSGAYKLTSEIGVLAKLGVVNNSPPAGASGAVSFNNPLLGGTYSLKLADEFRFGFFLGTTIPIGSGAGNTPDASMTLANSAGTLACSAMDNSLFAVNYWAVIPGVDFAYLSNGLTLQVEATLFQLTRVQGELVDKDSSRTNFTTAFAVGYTITPELQFEGELRYQRWLINNTVNSAASPAVENLSFAIGPRYVIKVGGLTFKPGIAYAQGLAGPIASSNYTSPTNGQKTLFLDVPVYF